MSERSHKPRLLLHVCCGPCATAVIERVVSRFEVICFWYNPNIEPTAEYQRRLAGMRTVAEVMGVPLVEGERDTPSYGRVNPKAVGVARYALNTACGGQPSTPKRMIWTIWQLP